MKSKEKILICYNNPVLVYENYIGKKFHDSSENVDSSETATLLCVEEIKNILSKRFEEVKTLAFNSDVEKTISQIRKIDPDIIFNLVEAVDGISNYEAYAAGIFELLNIPYTGNEPISLASCLNKYRTKLVLEANGIPTPKSFVAELNSIIEEEKFSLKFPVILKLLNEDASIGISELSVVNNFDDINKRLKFLFKTYKQNVLIEEFIEGRELNVAILGDSVLPISEIVFKGLPKDLPKIVTYEGKWSPESIYYKFTKPNCPAEIDEQTKNIVESAALKAFKILNCRDYARVDIRLSEKNIPYIIEVNPNPDISSDAGFARAAKAAGMNYSDLIKSIANFALTRKMNDQKVEA